MIKCLQLGQRMQSGFLVFKRQLRRLTSSIGQRFRRELVLLAQTQWFQLLQIKSFDDLPAFRACIINIQDCNYDGGCDGGNGMRLELGAMGCSSGCRGVSSSPTAVKAIPQAFCDDDPRQRAMMMKDGRSIEVVRDGGMGIWDVGIEDGSCWASWEWIGGIAHALRTHGVQAIDRRILVGNAVLQMHAAAGKFVR